MKEHDRSAISLTYGPREDQLLKEVDHLAEREVLPKNRNEFLRRAMYACRYLAEVDEKRLLELLSSYLHLAIKNQRSEDISIAKDLSYIIFATMISKQGILRAETFDTVPTYLALFDKLKADKVKTDKSDMHTNEDSIRVLGELAISVDTIFLKHNLCDKKSHP